MPEISKATQLLSDAIVLPEGESLMATVILNIIQAGEVDSPLEFAWLCYKSLPLGGAKILAAEMFPDQSIENAKSTLSKRFQQETLRVDEAIKVIEYAGQIQAFTEYLKQGRKG